ncbi:NtaA/DmoA family FMN-dependent monooxygenase [Microbacterium paludicola]|uniref:NtaA/DmoA family FMN-dependent monooxygenase n=1 Tax=Microbacterium paludicola TaxID=300019 RepID=UPI001430374F|nr:NtaA/DmoA family FMN-dependent monooxygenase [Microbacterium paludicola]MBF0816581.1 NtaA/DmoA family FMN-dependent monooxygenase [Microbacterium paludicola]
MNGHRDGQLYFNAFVQATPGHHYAGTWALPSVREHRYNDPKTWRQLGATLEKAKFDGVFVADTIGLLGTFRGNHDYQIEHAVEFPHTDAIIVATLIGATTEDLGIFFTSSMIQNHPFEFARLASAVDQMTNGRAGWNAVTSALSSSYRNVGWDDVPSREERYARVDEFMGVCYKAWEGSWSDTSVLFEVESGRYADPSQVRRIDHSGHYYTSAGPHASEPTPQRTPLMATAGGSAFAVDMAARHAEMMLSAPRNPAEARDMRKALDQKLIEYGRSPEDAVLFQNMHFVVGSTHEEAERKAAEIAEYIDPIGGLLMSGGIANLDLGMWDVDERFKVTDAPAAFQAHFGPRIAAIGSPETITIRELTGFGTPKVGFAGTPEEIADELTVWRDHGIGGVNLGDYAFHGMYEDFVDHVVPVLQERGLMQREYTPGTVRQKFFGQGDLLPSSHRAASHRWWDATSPA